MTNHSELFVMICVSSTLIFIFKCRWWKKSINKNHYFFYLALYQKYFPTWYIIQSVNL